MKYGEPITKRVVCHNDIELVWVAIEVFDHTKTVWTSMFVLNEHIAIYIRNNITWRYL